jgi:hypothetical protein
MKTKIVILLTFSLLLAGFHAESTEPIQKISVLKKTDLELCPPGKPHLFINFEGQKITAPASPDEKLTVIEKAGSQDKDEAQKAVMAMALAGNLHTFRDLLKNKDTRLLQSYAISYQNSNRTVCIDPEIEDAVIEHFDDPELRMPMLSFFVNNKYRGRAFFNKLLQLELDIKDMRTFSWVIKSLLATNLPGIEEEVFIHAKRYTVGMDLKYWWSLISIDQHYMEFFINRNYKPAVGYMKMILDETHYSKTRDMHLTHVINRHTAIYYRLDNFPSYLVEDIYAKQLGKLEDVEWDELFNIELELVGRYALKHALSYENRSEIVEHLSRILQNEAVFSEHTVKEYKTDYIDYKIRDRVYEMLTRSGTDAAGVALIRELNRLVEAREAISGHTLKVHILNKLLNLPGTVKLDIAEFMRAVPELDERTRVLIVPQILAKHPHPEGHAYLLSLLEFTIEYGEEYKMYYGHDYKKGYNLMISTLLLFDKAEYLFNTRHKVEELFEQGKLDEDLYVSSSKKINSLIGNESPMFTKLMERREAEEKARKRQIAKEEEAEWMKPFEEKIEDNMSREGIMRNIKALSRYGGGANNASKWLVIAGADIIPYAHEALRDPESSPEFKVKLINILGEIGDSRSIRPIIKATHKMKEKAQVYKYAFLALAQMPMTEASFAFAREQLENEREPIVHGSALIYFAIHRDQRALEWAKKYSSSDKEPRVRYAALYLSSRLGNKDATETILGLLKNETKRSEQEMLLRSLAELVSPEEFHRLTGKLGISKNLEHYKNALWISEFRNASDDVKSVYAEKLLGSSVLWDRMEGVRYLIRENQEEILQKYLLIDPRVELPFVLEAMQSNTGSLIIVEARKMGYRIEQTDGDINLVKIQKKR